MKRKLITITHIIPSLETGGAEMMLYKLIKYSDKEKYEHCVISMRDIGIMREKIEALGVKVYTLNMQQGMPSYKGFKKAIEYCQDTDIIQTWMYHANLFGYFVNKKLKKKLIWGIRQSHLIKRQSKWHTILSDKACVKLSNFKPLNSIVSCSDKAAQNHCKKGYNKNKMMVIYNGFETEQYYKKENISREKYGIEKDEIVLVTAGRWNYIKDYNNLLHAISLAKQTNDNICAVLCGKNMDENNGELIALIEKYQLHDYVKLMGRRDDLVDIFSISDIYVSASQVEGFPNVIGEAMLCELPCIVTDVGDSALIVATTGEIVQPKQPNILAIKIIGMIKKTEKVRKINGKKARERIKNFFDISNIVLEFENLYTKLLEGEKR